MLCKRYAVSEDDLVAIDESKAVFLLFASLSLFIMMLAAFLLWFLLAPRLAEIFKQLPLIFAALEAVALLFMGGSLFLSIISAMTEKDFHLFIKGRYFVLGILVPFSLWLGRRLGVPTDYVRNSYIKVNNSLVRSITSLISSRRILILIPHCLQRSECLCKICDDIDNCERCGQCVIYNFVELREKYGFDALVASGGTMARRLVAKMKPTAIIAIACERELASGIQDTFHIPVIGIPNIRPHGPCKDTQVDFEKVEETIRHLRGPTFCR